jgi:hypothetical protein
MDHGHIQTGLDIPPRFSALAPQKQAEIIWYLAHLVTTAYRANDAFLFWVIWTFCAGPGGSYTDKPAGLELQADIWRISTGRNNAVTMVLATHY